MNAHDSAAAGTPAGQTKQHCWTYRPNNNGDGVCAICGWDEPDHLRKFKSGEKVHEYLTGHAVVGASVVYLGVIHTVIDAGPEQGMRLAADKRMQ